jgi:polyisoprenoid-binding protein YceI
MPPRRDIDVSITLHGTLRRMRVPVALERSGDGLQVSGTLTLAQTAFGITPLSVLGGAIQVQDQVDVRFRIRTEPPH